jgi:hypothetical protein
MRDGKKRDESGRNFPYAGMCAECLVQDEVTRLVQSEPKRSTGEKLNDIFRLRGNRRRSTAEHDQRRDESCRGTHVAAFAGEAQQLL